MNYKQTFLNSLSSDQTRTAYKKDLTDFELFIKKEAELSTIKDLIDYKSNLKNKKYASLSINRKIASIRSYFQFLKSIGVCDKNPCEIIRPESVLDYKATGGLEDDEVVALLKTCKTKSIKDLRDSCLLQLLFLLGIRRAEVCCIKLADITLSSNVSTISILGKGKRVRTLPLPSVLSVALAEYIQATNHADNNNLWLFPGAKKDSHIHHNSITKILNNRAKMAGIKKHIHPHMARVTAASNALQNGAPINYVKEMGGWNNLEMVVRYDRRNKNLENSAVFKINYERKIK